MSSAHIIVCTASKEHNSFGYTDTFALLTLECARRDIALSIARCGTPGMLQHARNVIFVEACASRATYAFWWDSDIAFEPAGLFDVLDRVTPGVAIARPYPARDVNMQLLRQALLDWQGGTPTEADLWKMGSRWVCELDFVDGEPIWREGLVRLRVAGFGWCVMLVEDMRRMLCQAHAMAHFDRSALDKLPHDWLSRPHTHLFDSLQQGELGAPTTEADDWSFWTRWRASDRELWAASDREIVNGPRAGKYIDYLKRHALLAR